ncbi:replication-relaxation family protein [Plantactinospora sp. S1510]|uniref:Replication-relaxation family protein n=1 Tax=Plantactinospora alkalitolerans TaxID=2789879 RepID=A0ABS0H5E4_9ACTN|nr:replication-relaxation family protein [Plantactinospora alkalitolerans]MBF9133332.1 replication-relaxation family protein [Plantactinospora alkalitolerans]
MKTPHHPQFSVPSASPIPAELFLAEIGRLYTRDRWAVQMLVEHRTLTTAQLTALGFAETPTSAARRLMILARRGWIDRLPTNINLNALDSWWCLGPLGAEITRPDGGARVTPARVYRARDRLWVHQSLVSLLHTNQFFVDLAAQARTQPGTDLRTWWSPRTCAMVTGPERRATWHGEYIHDRGRHGFWFEPDPGGIGAAALADRVHSYPPLAERTGLATLLFQTADPQREDELRHLDRRNLRQLTIATSNPEQGHPAAPVWQPIGAHHRLALTELPHTQQLWPPDDPIRGHVEPLAPHPIHDPDRPGDEAIADGDYTYQPYL